MGKLVSKTKFLEYQKTFFNKVKDSPYSVNLIKTTVTVTPGTLEEFVGASTRSAVTNSFPCLYEKIVNDRQREKYGLPSTVDGLIFLSPLQLIPVYGDFVIDKNKTKVQFEFREQVIDHVVYMESMYGTCIGIQLNLRDDLKGG